MSLVHYPINLPRVGSISTSGVPTTLIDSNTVGPKSTRQLSSLSTATATVTWRFLGEDYKIFMAWWLTDLVQGSRRFYIPLPGQGSVAWHLARFTKPPTCNKKGYQYWDVSAELELASILDTFIEPESTLPAL